MATSFEDALLAEVVRAAQDVRLDVVLVGNAAAALQGAPVTTADFDFFLRDTPANERKLKLLAERLGTALTRPAAPLSRLVRLIGKPAPIDFVFSLSGGLRFESVRSRSRDVAVSGVTIRVASLEDVIASKRAAGRPKDLAALPILEQTARVLAEMHPERPREKPPVGRRRR